LVTNITNIKIKKRVRRDLGDLQPLIDSIRRYGLLNPIVISENYELIAGERRLEAAKALGWESIPVTITTAPNKVSQLEMEIEENVVRRDFSHEELLEGYASLEKLRNPPFFKRIWNSLKEFFTSSFDIKETRKKNKIKKNAILSLLLPSGIFITILGGVTYHDGYISIVFNTFLDITGIILILIGLFFLLKFLSGIKK
jgi:ParB family chromosome partitioning protein